MKLAFTEKVPQRPIGRQGLTVSAQGLGTMGMTAFYVADPSKHEADALATIDRALELGINFLDTAWIYMGPKGEKNEELVGKALAKHGRDKFVVATKCGIVPHPEKRLDFDSRPETIRWQVEDSLKRLGTDYIDLYYLHRVSPATPIESVMATFKELVAEGKIRYVGLSEVTGDELRRAHAVHPVTAVQMEWSLTTRGLEASVVPVARELGIGIVAYSPLCRGLLSGRIKSREDMEDGDWRKTGVPRFAEDNLAANAAAAARLEAIAARFGASAGQLALAWVHAQGNGWGDDVFPIPGTKSPARLEENAAAVALAARLTPADLAEIAAAVPAEEVKGDRYASNFGTWETRTDAAAAAPLDASKL